MNFSDYQNAVSSEKLTLAIVHASKRLMGWALDTGSTYKLANFDVASIVSLEDSGVAYTEATSSTSMVTSSFYNDRDNKVLYIRTIASDNPNGRYLALTQKLFFANAPITLPHDLSTGYEVYFEPMIKGTSAFGVTIDTINQTSEAIEGSGTLTLLNDQYFWPKNFDKLIFENKPVYIYSYNRGLPVSEAKLLYRGPIVKRSYSPSQIQFSLKDTLNALKAPLALKNLELLGLRTSSSMLQAKQRTILGRVFGHRPANVDEVLTGYPLSGSINATIGSVIVTGSGIDFYLYLSPDDSLVISGKEYRIQSVDSATQVTLTEVFADIANVVAGSILVKPDKNKRFANRVWSVAGHATKQPSTTTSGPSSINRISVVSSEDFYAGDDIYIGTLGTGEVATIKNVVSSKAIDLVGSLLTVPGSGTTVFKPSIQNLRMDSNRLTFDRDYSYNPNTGILTLRTTAESNVSEVRRVGSNLSFTSGSRVVTGTAFKAVLTNGDLISTPGLGTFLEIMSVDSDTSLTLRTTSITTLSGAGIFKPFIFDASSSVLSCDMLGLTEDGTSTGVLLKTAPQAVKKLLIDAGLSDLIDTPSFDDAKSIAYQQIGLVVPTNFGDKTASTYRDVINRLNISVFGSLVQTSGFKISYYVLRPVKNPSALKLTESDILKFTADSTAEKVVKTAIVSYAQKEYDYTSSKASIRTTQNTSSNATYLIKTSNERTFTTALSDETEASIHAKRWSFILEYAASTIQLTTKLQAAHLDVGSIIEINHRKLFERYSSNSRQKLLLIESIKKTGSEIQIEAVDLCNAFNRVSGVSDSVTDWFNASNDEKLYGGFYTDSYGLISNDPDSFGLNLIW